MMKTSHLMRRDKEGGVLILPSLCLGIISGASEYLSCVGGVRVGGGVVRVGYGYGCGC